MTIQERVTLATQVAGPTLGVLTFLTTFRAGELRAVVEDARSKPGDYTREALICTVLPVLSASMAAMTCGTAADAWATLWAGAGFAAPLGLFFLMYVVLVGLIVYQVLLAIRAWREWPNRR